MRNKRLGANDRVRRFIRNKLFIGIVVFCIALFFIMNALIDNRDIRFDKSFMVGERLHQHAAGREVYWDGQYVFLNGKLFKYNQNEYKRIKTPRKLNEKIFYDDGDPKYYFVSQYNDKILFLLNDGEVITYSCANKSFVTILDGLNRVNSPCIMGDFLYGINTSGIVSVDLKTGTYHTQQLPFFPFHNFVIDNDGYFYLQTMERIESNNEVDFKQSDFRYKDGRYDILSTYVMVGGLWKVDSCGNNSMFYSLSDMNGENCRFFESSINGRNQIGQSITEEDETCFSSDYNKYYSCDYIIFVPDVEEQFDEEINNESDYQNRMDVTIMNKSGAIIEVLPISTMDNENLTYHCCVNGTIYLFVENIEENTIRIQEIVVDSRDETGAS